MESTEQTSYPKDGIFWVIDGEFIQYAYDVPTPHGITLGVENYTHKDVWEKIKPFYLVCGEENKPMKLQRLGWEHAALLHAMIGMQADGKPGYRNSAMLEVAVGVCYKTSGDCPHLSLKSQAAHLCCNIFTARPFKSNNASTAILAMLVFLELNGCPASFTDEDIVKIGRGLANETIGTKELEGML